MGLTPTPPVTAASAETLLEFPDNRLLIDLCGPNDRHLARIEEALGVHILRRGNQIAVGRDRGRLESLVVGGVDGR